MDKYDELKAIKNMIAKLKAYQETEPNRPSKPRKQDNQSHAEYGLLMDQYEWSFNEYRAKIRTHRELEWQIERDIEQLIKKYLGLTNHPKCNDIWDYVKNNFDGHGYMELLESAEELLDIFGIK